MNEGGLSSDECLVRVRAQVMTRDDSTGGWAAVVGGGLSFVGLRRLSTFLSTTESATAPLTLPSSKKTTKVHYLITGHRISDDSVCLECVVRRDLQYNQVTPTFRHWQVQGKKFGLTFQSSGDAKAFDLAVDRALKELKSFTPEPSPTLGKSIASEEESWDEKDISTGSEKSESMRRIPGKPARIFTTKPLPNRRSASPQLSSISVPSPVRYSRAHVAEPAKRILSLPSPSPGTMTKSLSTPFQSQLRDPALPLRLSTSHIGETLSTPLVAIKSDGNGNGGGNGASCQERYTYVDVISAKSGERNERTEHAERTERVERASGSTVYGDPPSGGPHDYHYSTLDKSRTSEKRDSISSIKMHNLDMMSSHRPPLLPIKNSRKRSRKHKKYTRGERSRCKFCHEFYLVDANEPGVCEFAPDTFKACIKRISCLPTAAKIFFCCSSSQTDVSQICSCDTNVRNCFWRWLALSALSLILPCLCLYYPLRGCHKMGVTCGLCGGRHEAMT